MTQNPAISNAGMRLVFVTGPSGAGRATAINALEDLGYEAIDNLPLAMVPRLLHGPPPERPLALGIDARTRDFSPRLMLETIADLRAQGGLRIDVLFLDSSDDVLLRRFSETRRRHPLAPDSDPASGIADERALLGPVRTAADILVDTSDLSPHALRAEIGNWFGGNSRSGTALSVTVQSFSYKRGMPRGLDMALDVRFLTNPYWDAELRPLDGRAEAVANHIAADPRFSDFFDKMSGLVTSLLPAYRDEGKAHFSVGFGCTGGQHRSVFVAQLLAKTLAADGWQVSIRHEELERRGGGVDSRGTV